MRTLLQDRWIAVVDKPSGLPSQPTREGGDNLFDRLKAQHGYVGLHHRLDTPASGLLVVALHPHANAGLADAFRERRVDRRYLAGVLGEAPEAGTWNRALDGKPAHTRFERRLLGEDLSVLEVKLETGRTHQIRRHAQSAGLPLLGDRRYGGAAGRLWPRLALHAWRLAFAHPVTGEPIALEAELPPDLRPLLDEGLL